ncbi:MAG: hypothetical protein GY679_03345 [Mycoplasma sp.]|nr:hypothetical protein [Mycoplasma sp.]
MKRVSIPIIRRDFDKTNSSRFKGDIEIISNDKGIIFDWKVNFTYVEIDLYSTPSWFKKKNQNFLRRKSFLNLLMIEQEPRPTTSSNKLKELNSEQLKILNNFLNNRTMYSSTIKNIVAFLKGNNPGGEAKNPKSAEMIIDSKKTLNSFENFVILFDDLMIKKNHRDSSKNLFDLYSLSAETISLEDFSRLNNNLYKAFEYMQKEKEPTDFEVYLQNIKDYYLQFNNFVDKATKIVNKARSRYSKNIDKYVVKLPFGLEEKSQFQKAHIIDVHKLKIKIVDALIENKGYERIINLIEDPQNFIPLIESIHRQFDQNNISYNQNGEMIALNNKGQDFIDKYVGENFKYIDEFFWTEKRKEYIKERNHN